MDNSILANNAKSITLRIDAMRIANRITNPKIHYAKLNTKYHVKDEKGVHDSYFLISGDETNLNNWGVVGSSIPQNIQTGIGKPFVITSTDFIPNSYYKADYMHPNMIHFKKNLPQMVEGLDPDVYEDNLKFQEPYKVATIEKVFFNKPKDLWEVMILREPQFEDKEMPPFCSIAIFQNDKTEPEDKMTKWSVVHLAGLTESPAFGDQAIYNGKCNGSITSCSFRFADSKAQAETDLELAKGKMQIAKEDFKEEDHPRAPDGRFGDKPGDSTTKESNSTLTPKQTKILHNDEKSVKYLVGLDEKYQNKVMDVKQAFIDKLGEEKFLLDNRDKINDMLDKPYTAEDLKNNFESTSKRIKNSMPSYQGDEKFKQINEFYPIDKKLSKIESSLDKEQKAFYNARYEQADTFFRGTSTEELDQLLKHGTFGGGDPNYKFVCLTINESVGEKFNANSMMHKGQHVYYSIDKSSIEDEIVSQGYSAENPGDNEVMNDPEGTNYMWEEEHRIPNNTVKVKDVKMKIYARLTSDYDIQEFTKKYGSLGEIISTWKPYQG